MKRRKEYSFFHAWPHLPSIWSHHQACLWLEVSFYFISDTLHAAGPSGRLIICESFIWWNKKTQRHNPAVISHWSVTACIQLSCASVSRQDWPTLSDTNLKANAEIRAIIFFFKLKSLIIYFPQKCASLLIVAQKSSPSVRFKMILSPENQAFFTVSPVLRCLGTHWMSPPLLFPNRSSWAFTPWTKWLWPPTQTSPLGSPPWPTTPGPTWGSGRMSSGLMSASPTDRFPKTSRWGAEDGGEGGPTVSSWAEQQPTLFFRSSCAYDSITTLPCRTWTARWGACWPPWTSWD